MKNNNTSTVLILGNARGGKLTDALYDLGYLPVVRGNMLAALEAIRHSRFRAIFFDQNPTNVDVLEFILNIRDFDEQTPIFVMKSAIRKSESELTVKQKNVLLLESIDELLELEPGEG
ncbi:MAG: hypothetical protein ACE5I1_22910 [bacterium]